MLKSEYLEKKLRWFKEKYSADTWEAKWTAWVESNPDVPGDELSSEAFEAKYPAKTVSMEPETPAQKLSRVAHEPKKKKASKKKM